MSINIFQYNLVDEKIPRWERITKLRALFDEREKSYGDPAKWVGAASAEIWEEALHGGQAIDKYIKEVSEEKNIEKLLLTAFSHKFNYDLLRYFHMNIDEQILDKEEIDSFEDKGYALQDIITLLSLDAYGTCKKCNKNYDVRYYSDNDYRYRVLSTGQFEPLENLKLTVTKYCNYHCDNGYKSAPLGKKYKTAYINQCKNVWETIQEKQGK